MARIAGVNIPNNKHADIALTQFMALVEILHKKYVLLQVYLRLAKVKDLNDAEVEKLRDEVAKVKVEGDLRREVSMNIKRLMDLRLLSWCAPSSWLASAWSTYKNQCAYA